MLLHLSSTQTSLLGLKRWRSREKAEGTEPLEPVLVAQRKSNSSFAAQPTEDNRVCVLFRKEAPGPGHQSCSSTGRSLAVSSSPNSTFILSPSVNSQTSHHRLLHTGASPEWVLQTPTALLRGLGCGHQRPPSTLEKT